ncbi:MAG: hypothetical protein ABIL58_14895 [Pseudomonadota bacterium]
MAAQTETRRRADSTLRMSHLWMRRLLIGALVLTVGCTATYGRLARSRDVDDQFTRSEVRTGYRYYSFGSQNAPLAIMGIDGRYTLATSVWTPLENLTPEILKARVEGMTDQLGFSPANYGGVLLTPDGTPFGIWYSRYADATIAFGENNTVSVTPPRRTEREGDGPFLRQRD